MLAGGANLTVAEVAAHSKPLSLLESLCFLPRFTDHTPVFVSWQCVNSQSAPRRRKYLEWAATLRGLLHKHYLLPWKSDGQTRLA